MNAFQIIKGSLASVAGTFLLTGCGSTDYGHTSPYNPGPVAGKTVGTGVGLVAGNVAGFGVGVVEGVGHGVAAPFNSDYHMVRQWRTETTSDGRTIQVPCDILVDKYGRPVSMPAPTGNPKPPSSPPPQPSGSNPPAQ